MHGEGRGLRDCKARRQHRRDTGHRDGRGELSQLYVGLHSPVLPSCLLGLVRARLVFAVLGQPVTWICVLCLKTAPFWATNLVGIFSFARDLQRLPFAASAEYLPSGRYNSKVPTGTSGTVLNVLLVMPALLMNVVPVRSTLTPSPCSTTTSDGNASPPWETKYTGPVNGTGSSGVVAFTTPTIEAAGQLAGFDVNFAAVHACCSVVRREGNCFGRSTFACATFASLPTEPTG